MDCIDIALFQSSDHSKHFTGHIHPVHTHIHTLAVGAAMQGANPPMRRSK